MPDPTDPNPAGEPDRPAGSRGRPAGVARRAAGRYARTRQRLDRTTAGRVQRRVAEIDLANQVLILAALTLMLIIPLLISIAAILPLGGAAGTLLAHRIGLTPDAARDLAQLFPSPQRVRGATTLVGVVIALVSAFSLPLALQRGYELAWRVPPLGWRGLWRAVVWLIGFVVLIGGVAAITGLVHGWAAVVGLALPGLAIAIAWAWWSQHLLLGGRIGWRALLPGAIASGIGLVAMRVTADLFLSVLITTHYQRYGPLGIVFLLLSWFIAFSVIVLGGAVLGAELHERRLRRAGDR